MTSNPSDALNLPWRLEQPDQWPFDLRVIDATGLFAALAHPQKGSGE